jgi:hypothetical protein
MMKFAPKPENDFYEFIRIYYRECRARFPKIQAIAGKWMYRDLIPGMSDFDSRFILDDDMTVDDWCEMSTIVGQVHLEIAHRFPLWWRNLEHLPGINLTWSEMGVEKNYYPEYQLWTYYETDDQEKLGQLLNFFVKRGWDEKDEYFHLKRFITYFGRYNRTIDPAINLGIHENKYPLHSRLMHYFNPPVHSAVCILTQKNMPGKFNAFEMANHLFPELECWDIIQEIFHKNYESPYWYFEPALSMLEDKLEIALIKIAEKLREAIKIISVRPGTDIIQDINQWKMDLTAFQVDPIMKIFEKSRFSRLFKGRLRFYINAPEGYDNLFLIQNEFGRIGELFFKVPYQTYWEVKTGEYVTDPIKILPELLGQPLSQAEIDATKTFAQLAKPETWVGNEFSVAEKMLAIYDDFFKGLYAIAQEVSESKREPSL